MAYTITGEKCGTVRLDAEKTGVVVTESVQRSSKVTSNPVEKGSDINDHVINDPVVFSITGVFLDEDQSDILERMWKEKDVVEYTGRTRISDCVITSFKSDISADNKNGSKFTVSLKVINRVSAEYVASGEQMMSAQDANASKKVSKSQTKSTTADGLHGVKADKTEFVSFSIPATGWKTDSSVPGYTNYIDIAISGLTAADYVAVDVAPASSAVARAANFVATESRAGILRLRAASVPTATIAAQYHIITAATAAKEG